MARKVRGIHSVRPRHPHWLWTPFRKGWFLSCKINILVNSHLNTSEVEKIHNIEGHLTLREGAVLYYFSFTPFCEGRVVEIGSFKGKSTSWIATALRDKKLNDRVVAIDPHINTYDFEVVPDYEETSSFAVFKENLLKMQLTSWVETLKMTSEAAAENWTDPVRLLFVDGSHRHEDVLKDFQLWEPLVAQNGIICVHDTKYFPGVVRATKEYFDESTHLKDMLRLKNMRVFQKIKMEC